MKKLMIAAAIAIVGISANAASVLWEAGDVYTFTGADKTSTEYVDGGYLAYWIDAASYGYSDAQTALANGETAFITTYGHAGDIADGYIDPVDVSGYANGTAVTGYVVILNSDAVANATYAYLSDPITKSTGAEGQAAGMVFDTSDSGMGANWIAVSGSVPEPTSGLLLLLGVAGLALRRRRA